MTFQPNDPIWTTFILEPDSLPAEQRQTLEHEIATNAACREFVDELRVAAGLLKSELQAEMQPTADGKETLVAINNAAAVTPRKMTRFSVWMRIVAGTLAGALLVGVFVNRVLVGRATSQLADGNAAQKRALYKLRAYEMRLGTEQAASRYNIAETESNPGEIIKEESHESLTLNSKFTDSASFVDGSRSMDVDAAPIQVELSDFNEKSAPRNDLAASAGPITGSGLSGRGAAANGKTVVRSGEPVPSNPLPRDIEMNREELTTTRLDRDRQFLSQKVVRRATPLGTVIDSRNLKHDERRLKASTLFDNEAPENTESYPALSENPFIKPAGLDALSTFSIDVDTASYSNIRRFLQHATQPPPGAVRLEEMINYFRYDYAPPKDDKPFAVHVEMAQCPWEPKHRLARVALKGKVIDQDKRPASNLVFLLDVSGSMDQPNKLPLVKRSLQLLVEQLTENDRVAIAVYAGSSGLVLDSTPGNNKQIILNAIENLQPSGSTNGAAGIKVAYEAAVKGFIPKATNRVILCTDGDFNVGVSSDDELVDLITEKAKTGVFLSVLGFGMGNYKDAKMMGLADKGNGNYAYIDNVREANKVLVEQMSGTLVTIAKDVKIQVEFNPQKVAAYRLIGYEKRMLAAQDFKDDKKDAGEIGAGHTVTAFYEIVPAGEASPAEKIDPLEFQPDKTKPRTAELPAELAELAMRVKLRYKQPDGDTSVEFAVGVPDETKPFAAGSKDFQFAAAVAGFGRVLRANEQQAKMTLDAIQEIAASAKGEDASGYRAEFLELVNRAQKLPAYKTPVEAAPGK